MRLGRYVCSSESVRGLSRQNLNPEKLYIIWYHVTYSVERLEPWMNLVCLVKHHTDTALITIPKKDLYCSQEHLVLEPQLFDVR